MDRNLPEKNSRVMAWLEGAKDHSGVTWHRCGWAEMVMWENGDPHTVADGWSRELYDNALKKLDADYLTVIKWIPFSAFNDMAITVEPEARKLTCVRAHDLCHGGASAPCMYCEYTGD